MVKITSMSSGAIDPILQSKRVFFRPDSDTDTIRVGQLVCYNSDIEGDHKERTVDPTHLGLTKDTYAEGAQDFTGRLFIVEKPTAANVRQFAGVVKALGPKAGADGDMIEIWTLNGGVVPVWVDATCVLDETIIGVLPGSYNGAAHLLDGENYVQNKDEDSPLAIGIAMESIDRDTTNGLVWVRLFSEIGVSPYTAYFAPVRSTSTVRGYAMGVNIDGTKLLRGTTISKSYVLNIDGEREEAYPCTGDSNDAMLKISGSNYAANDANFIFRGLNSSITNRSPGVMGRLEGGAIGAQNKGGGTVTVLIGLTVVTENYGTLTGTDEFGGIDVVLKNEATVAATEFGIRLNNDNNSVADSIHAAFIIEDSGANTGWDNLFDFDNCTGTIVSEDDQAYPDKLGSLKLIMPSGGAGYINIYDGAKT